ncbi:hypothetical protein [Oligella ureolytica]|nr:hypothetical protein [Oligella ureolytica]
MGSRQLDALQNITGTIDDIQGDVNRGASGAFQLSYNLGSVKTGTVDGNSAASVYSFDASRVARTSSETRGSNVALAPRIIAF